MLKHLKAREGWDEKSLSAKGFTLIELLVVIVILGVLAAVVIFAVGSVRDRAETNACKTDTKTIKTAIAAWNTEYLSAESGSAYDTPYPIASGTNGFGDLVASDTQLLQEPSDLHTLTGGNTTAPTIGKVGTKCGDETITQFS